MKARVFPKLDIPNDLDNLEKFIDHFDTVQEQIEFLKYVKNEIKICFELTDTDVFDLDLSEYQEIENAEKIIDKKIEFYEELLGDENRKNNKETNKNLEEVEKAIENEIKSLGEGKNAFFKDGELWMSYKIQLRRIEEIVNEKTSKPLYNKKQIERIRKGIETISRLRKKRNEIILERVKRELKGDLYDGKTGDLKTKMKFPSFDYDIYKIKEFGNSLDEENMYKYYLRIDTDLKRIIDTFNYTEFRHFDGNMFFGLIAFIDSVEYILSRDKCKELDRIVREKIKNLKITDGETDFQRIVGIIEFELILQVPRLVKTRELIGYEIEYLEKILGIEKEPKNKRKDIEEEKIEIIEKDGFGKYEKNNNKDLKNFRRGELQKELEPFAKEHNLEIGESVPSKKVRLITRKLIEKGWDAKSESVAEAFRKMGFVKGRRK